MEIGKNITQILREICFRNPEFILQKLAESNLNEALEMLMNLEKQTRQGADMHSTAKVLICIVQLCYEAKQWTLLNEHIVMLTKKR